MIPCGQKKGYLKESCHRVVTTVLENNLRTILSLHAAQGRMKHSLYKYLNIMEKIYSMNKINYTGNYSEA